MIRWLISYWIQNKTQVTSFAKIRNMVCTMFLPNTEHRILNSQTRYGQQSKMLSHICCTKPENAVAVSRCHLIRQTHQVSWNLVVFPKRSYPTPKFPAQILVWDKRTLSVGSLPTTFLGRAWFQGTYFCPGHDLYNTLGIFAMATK